MKKNLKVLIVVVLTLVMVLSLFAGCGKKTFQEKYGISFTDKTVNYDGNAYSTEITVDAAILGGKTYTVDYTYSKDGTALTGTEFKDAGVYSVSASVLVAGEKEPTVLSAKLTINKYEVTIEMGNLFLRQGQGLSSLGTPSYDAQLVGGDKFSSLGGLSYEIYNGSTKVTDLTALKPTAKESDALSVQAVFTTTPKNYDVKFTNGKLYVLSGADYDVANKLKTSINKAPTENTIGTFTYSEMKDFVNTADYILEKYPSTSAIQRLMSGTVNIDTISSLLKTAKNRVATVYDIEFDIDSAVGSMSYVGINHTNNDKRLTTDDGYVAEFLGSKTSSIKSAEYGDTVGFKIVINDTTKYKLLGVTIRGKYYTTTELTSYGFTEAPLGTYTIGTANATAPTNSYYGTANKGLASGGVLINSTLLGALDGKGYITITPDIQEIYTVKVAGKTTNTYVSKDNISTEAANLSYLTLTSKGVTYRDLSSTSDISKQVPSGSECKITIFPKTGYIISEVELGDKIVSGSDFNNNSYEFTIDDSYVNSNKEMIIKITFMESYSFKVYVNGKSISNTSKTAVYKTTEGTVSLENVTATIVPTIVGEKTLKLFAVPSENYVLTKLELVGKKGTTKTLTYTTDAKESPSGLVEIDLGTGTASLFESSTEITIYATFDKQFPVVVKAGINGDTTDVTMTYDRGIYTSKYGTVALISKDKQENFNNMYDGQKYFISLTSESGYVPKTVKVYNTNSGTTLYTFTLENSEAMRYKMINDSSLEVYIGALSTAKLPANMTETDALTLSTTNLDAGSNLVIEVTYEAYYWVDFIVNKPSSSETSTIKIQGYLDTADNNAYKTTGTAPTGTEIDSTSGVIRAGNSYYIYYKAGTSTSTKIIFTMTAAANHKIENIEGYIGKSELNTTSYISAGSTKTYMAPVEDAIGGDYATGKILPGGTIEVYYSATFATVT